MAIAPGYGLIPKEAAMTSYRYAIAVLLSAAFNAQAAVVGFGSLTDPLEGFNPDLASASITIDSSGSATFFVDLGPLTSLADASPTFIIDIDQNPATGAAGVTDTHLDAGLIGAEYVLSINASIFQANASLRGFSGGGFSFLGSFAVTYSGSTMTTSLNLSNLGADDGLMNFKVLSQRQVSEGAWTFVQDFMSDVGQPVGIVARVPEPGAWTIIALGLLALLVVQGRRRLAA
jgi:hypothetical protein